ncbi:MAG: Bug family tripartite tricarboxylate transporter substrate binding protein [Xanthobacteraceae bacterium]
MSVFKLIAAAATLIGATAPAATEDWPTRAVTLVVPFAAGGPMDTVGRILALRMSELLRQQVVVENVGGAGGMTGSARVAKAAPDGYQFLLGNVGTHAGSQTFYKNPLYNAVTDFAPVALIAEIPFVLVTRKDFPAGNLREFTSHARANHATMQYGSGGSGSATHLACVLLNAAIGVNVTHVPYRGGGPAMQDLMAGRIDYQCLDTALAIPQIEANTIKAIAILTRERSPILPAVASAHEQGLNDFEASNWSGLFLPKGAPVDVLQALHAATVGALETPSVQERFKELGATVVAPDRRSPEYLQRFVADEVEKWAVPIKASGASIN